MDPRLISGYWYSGSRRGWTLASPQVRVTGFPTLDEDGPSPRLGLLKFWGLTRMDPRLASVKDYWDSGVDEDGPSPRLGFKD